MCGSEGGGGGGRGATERRLVKRRATAKRARSIRSEVRLFGLGLAVAEWNTTKVRVSMESCFSCGKMHVCAVAALVVAFAPRPRSTGCFGNACARGAATTMMMLRM